MFKKDLENRTPDIRHLKDMTEVIYDRRWLKSTDINMELYYMYRNLKHKEGLRYDITIIPANMLGSEFVKTKGHSHSEPRAELYIVLQGNAIYFMQKKENGIISDAYYVKAKKGDNVIVPKNYGHVTINASDNKLVMANWISEKEQKSDYKSISEKKGACYYYTETGWIKNKNYKKVPKLRYKLALKSMPKDLNFLK